jgi:MscS family membrane protein
MAVRFPSKPGRSRALQRACRLIIVICAAWVPAPAILLAQQDTAVTDPTPVQTAAEQAPAGAPAGLRNVARTNSPRDTLASFQRLGAAFETAMTAYRQSHDRARARQLELALDQWLTLFDLSEVPEAPRRDVGAQTAAYLLDIFNRVPLPDLADVPARSDSPASYAIPNTPFRIVRIDTGPRQGEYLFSSHTVSSAPGFFRVVENLPVSTSPAVNSWGAELRKLTGPMVPAALAALVPERLQDQVLGTPIWKVMGVAGLTLAAVLLLLLFNRTTNRPASGSLAGERWRLLLGPAAVLIVALGLRDFATHQIIVAGQFATLVFAAFTAAIFLAMAWGFWVFVLAVFETAISRRALPEQNFDAHMLRLIARMVGFVGAITIVAYGAQDIGLPVFSLLAGLGIGGIAIALAIRPTLENLIAGFVLFLDKPIRVGDFCSFGGTSGTVESIGVRSTQIRASDRSLITVPNAQFADMQIVNWAQCDRMLIRQTIGLRYETEEDQLRHLVVKLREMLIGHPRIDSDTVRVRFSDFGSSSLDVDIRAYAMTRDWSDFFAIKEDIQFRTMSIVTQSGTGFALPSQTLYLGRDNGIDAALAVTAKQEVSAWRRSGQFPFPNLRRGAAAATRWQVALSAARFARFQRNAGGD